MTCVTDDKIVDFDRIQGRLAGAPVRRSLIKLVSIFNSVAAVGFVIIGVIVGLVVTDGSFGGFLLGLIAGAIVAVEVCGSSRFCWTFATCWHLVRKTTQVQADALPLRGVHRAAERGGDDRMAFADISRVICDQVTCRKQRIRQTEGTKVLD